MAQKYTATVTKKEKVSSKVYCLTFTLVSPPALSFKAGQNIMLMIAPGINRTMSIASSPSTPESILIAHDVAPQGPGSLWTEHLKIGDTATFVAPTGGVLSLLPTNNRKVLIATGTGIAPFRAVLYDYLEKPHTAPIVLYWGVRFMEDLFWQDEFDALAKTHADFSWQLIYSKPPEEWVGPKGHVTEFVLEHEKDMENSEFYICGNKAMVDEVQAVLLERKVPNEHIKRELFY